jgi:hypothetical protein
LKILVFFAGVNRVLVIKIVLVCGVVSVIATYVMNNAKLKLHFQNKLSYRLHGERIIMSILNCFSTLEQNAIISHDIKCVEIYYSYKPCTQGKRYPTSIIVQDVTRLLLKGLESYIYKTTKHKFIKISLIIVRGDIRESQ